MRTEQLTAYRELLEGSRIRVANKQQETGAGLYVVPEHGRPGYVAVFYQRNLIGLVVQAERPTALPAEGHAWRITNRSRLFPTLPAACFALAANYLIQGGAAPASTSETKRASNG